MEQFLECYLDEFKEAPRNSLHDRRNRTQMVEYISTLIQGCSSVNNDDVQITCNKAIGTLIQYHRKAKSGNGFVCMMGKYHNILYVAMKLCYLWQLEDAGTIALLLTEIYNCEKTFERILIGAIFGTKAPHYIAGWKSDFENQEENVRGLVYFLDKANKSKLEFTFDNKLFRFIDLPIESCGKSAAVKICLQLGLPDKLLILLRFGALLSINNCAEDTFSDHIMKRLMEFNHCYPYNLVACLQLLLRVIPTLQVRSSENNDLTNLKEVIIEKYGDLVEDGLIPLSRCGYSPPELKHLCRCSVREVLWEKFQLPNGLHLLPLPDNIRRYLDILED